MTLNDLEPQNDFFAIFGCRKGNGEEMGGEIEKTANRYCYRLSRV